MKINQECFRTDLEDYFRLSGNLNGKLNHTPFIVLDEENGITICDSAEKIMGRFRDDTIVLSQWGGQWRSDFFSMTVGDIKRALISSGRL